MDQKTRISMNILKGLYTRDGIEHKRQENKEEEDLLLLTLA